MKPGHIRIIDGIVNFVFHELGKPDKSPGLDGSFSEDINYIKSVEKFIASKRTIEVSNYYDLHEKAIRIIDARCQFEDKQPCEAEITDNEAIITKIS